MRGSFTIPHSIWNTTSQPAVAATTMFARRVKLTSITRLLSTFTRGNAALQTRTRVPSTQWKMPQIAQFRGLTSSDNAQVSAATLAPVDAAAGAIEDALFDMLAEGTGAVSVNRLLNLIETTGLRLTDPRLKECMTQLIQIQKTWDYTKSPGGVVLDRKLFRQCIADNIVLMTRIFQNEFIVPEFKNFCDELDRIYWRCKTLRDGKVADYIPQLSRYSPDLWGVSICTVDGQRHSIGDANWTFALQSAAKTLTYALILNDIGAEVVHQYVGHEPSGVSFNEICLNAKNKPHNPMINAGAIVAGSLLRNDLKLADRFEYLTKQYKRMAGGEYVGFNNSIFLSERETADRNFALAYYMKENQCFPPGSNLTEFMDFYFMMCSTEITCESGAVIASTLANGGICPLTGDNILSTDAVRDTLSLMYSCGMYDYSGQFAFKVGLPAKSGVSGIILLVIPNLAGICMWSPPLDVTGNSVRGIQFCKDLVSTYAFHNYDNVKRSQTKKDPRRIHYSSRAMETHSLIFAAFKGDLTSLRRMALRGTDMNMADYDGRTALHVAAAEGKLETVEFLLQRCRANINAVDRWGNRPMDDAIRFKHENVVQFLKDFDKRAKQQTSDRGLLVDASGMPVTPVARKEDN